MLLFLCADGRTARGYCVGLPPYKGHFDPLPDLCTDCLESGTSAMRLLFSSLQKLSAGQRFLLATVALIPYKLVRY